MRLNNFIGIGLSIALSLTYPINTYADDVPTEPFPILTTAYCVGKITYSGAPVREGICAVKKEWIGKTALIYTNNNGEIGGCWEYLNALIPDLVAIRTVMVLGVFKRVRLLMFTGLLMTCVLIG